MMVSVLSKMMLRTFLEAKKILFQRATFLFLLPLDRCVSAFTVSKTTAELRSESISTFAFSFIFFLFLISSTTGDSSWNGDEHLGGGSSSSNRCVLLLLMTFIDSLSNENERWEISWCGEWKIHVDGDEAVAMAMRRSLGLHGKFCLRTAFYYCRMFSLYTKLIF